MLAPYEVILSGPVYENLHQQASFRYLPREKVFLTLSYPEHLCSACWAYTLSCWPTIFHGYVFRVFHFFLSTALHEHFYRGIACKYNQYDIKLKIAAEEDRVLRQHDT